MRGEFTRGCDCCGDSKTSTKNDETAELWRCIRTHYPQKTIARSLAFGLAGSQGKSRVWRKLAVGKFCYGEFGIKIDEKNRGGISTFSWMVDGLKSANEARHCGIAEVRGDICGARNEFCATGQAAMWASAMARAASSAATPMSISLFSMMSGGATTKWLTQDCRATPRLSISAAT
jgi:hypothetical protein